MDANQLAIRMGVALGLGLLIGLQRERANSRLAGFRTFALVGLLGAIAGWLWHTGNPWAVPAGFVSLAALIVGANLANRGEPPTDPGVTTEVAALVTFAIGVLVAVGEVATGVVAAGAVVLLLHLKEPMHAWARTLSESDFRAMMQFVLVALVILPVLPDTGYGPPAFRVVNPREVWLMVVLIVTINLAGYVVYKLAGARAGAVLGGLIGGLISSTATTMSYAKRSREAPDGAGLATFVVVAASLVSTLRICAEAAVAAPSHMDDMLAPLGMMALIKLVVVAALFMGVRKGAAELPQSRNPAELRSAISFGVLYALVIVSVTVARHFFGAGGVTAVAVLSGLTDMDAITLSTSRLVEQGHMTAHEGWRAVVVASMANMVFKGGLVAALGSRALAWRVAAVFAVVIAGQAALLVLWT